MCGLASPRQVALGNTLVGMSCVSVPGAGRELEKVASGRAAGLRTVPTTRAASGCWRRAASHVRKVREAVRAVGEALHKHDLARAVGGEPQHLQQLCGVAASTSSTSSTSAGLAGAKRLDVRHFDHAVAVHIKLEKEVRPCSTTPRGSGCWAGGLC